MKTMHQGFEYFYGTSIPESAKKSEISLGLSLMAFLNSNDPEILREYKREIALMVADLDSKVSKLVRTLNAKSEVQL